MRQSQDKQVQKTIVQEVAQDYAPQHVQEIVKTNVKGDAKGTVMAHVPLIAEEAVALLALLDVVMVAGTLVLQVVMTRA